LAFLLFGFDTLILRSKLSSSYEQHELAQGVLVCRKNDDVSRHTAES